MESVRISLIDAPFPEQWKEEMHQFINELSAIKESVDVLSTSIEKSSEARGKLAEYYEEGGSASSVASRPIAPPDAGPILNRYGQPFASTPPDFDEADTREMLADLGYDVKGTQPSSGRSRTASGPPEALHYPPLTEEPAAEGSYAQQYLREHGPMEMPQYYGGQYTAQDLLKGGAQLFQYAQDNWASTPEGPMGTAANILARGASAMPKISLAQQYLGTAQGVSQGWEDYASTLGYQAGEGFSLGPLGSSADIDVLGTHFRPPMINPTALSGVTQKIGTFFGDALKYPGLTTQDAMGIQTGLAERGWFPDKPQSQLMFDTQAELFSKGGVLQQISQNPGFIDLQEKALRSGTTSIEDFIKTIESIPDAAKSANESVDQMIADMNAFGEFSQSTGGTHWGGAQQALQISATTGLPAGAMQGLLESPWARSAIFRSTGQPTWMQGSLSGTTKNQAAMQGFFQLAHAVGRPQGYNKKLGGGYTDHVSGIEQQAAMMHEFGLPNMKPETIAKLLRQGPGSFRRRNEVLGQASAWRDQAFEILRDPSATDDQKDTYLSGSEAQGTNFAHLLKLMAAQKTATGARMFSQSDIKQIRQAGIGEHGEELAKAKYNAIQEVLGVKAGKTSDAAGSPGQTVQIDLSPAARKFLQLPNKKSQMKLGVNGGSGQTTNSSYTGYTDPLFPSAGFTMGNQVMSPDGTFSPIP